MRIIVCKNCANLFLPQQDETFAVARGGGAKFLVPHLIRGGEFGGWGEGEGVGLFGDELGSGGAKSQRPTPPVSTMKELQGVH